MFCISIIFLTLFIPSIQSSKPTLKLTFTPDEKYYTVGNQVEILCELINPTDHTESPQLWHVDLKTGKHTPISRALLNRPTEDSLDVFKQNKLHRLEFVKKNHLRIRQILTEDTARYECNCPDCEEALGKQAKDFQVVKLSEPKWHIEPGWPIQEHAKTTIKCTADDFYPYVSHKILRNHHEVIEGKATLPTSNTYPQKFSWEATVTPAADWHNTTLRCTLTEGNHEQHAIKVLDVIFTPRFGTCSEKQFINSSSDKAIIECSYSGNPKPTLTWLRQTDEKPITTDTGITIKEVDEHHGKYKSIVTFEREKLAALQVTTTTRAPGVTVSTTSSSKLPAENYYLQLLNGGFIARLLNNNNEVKDSRKITIVSDANQARSSLLGSSAQRIIQNLSTSILLLFSYTILQYMIQKH